LGWLTLEAQPQADPLPLFEAEVERCEQEDLTPLAGIARLELARALLRRGQAGDKARALEELELAISVFQPLGMTAPLGDAQVLLRQARRGRPPPRGRPYGLTDREVEVLELIAGGLSNAAISQALTVSPKTVERHISNILTKMGARDRTQAAVAAVQQGIVQPRHP
jgi:DNA-binding NarL/FixJ family response regulator